MTTEDRLEKVGRVTVPVKVLALLAFLGTLLLDWQRVSVEAAGAVDIEETTIGWNGWGFAAGVFALLLLALMFGEVRRGQPTASNVFTAGVLPLALVIATALAVFTGEANVSVAGTVAVVVTTLWAAWLGLALAMLTAAAYVVELLAQLPERGAHGLAPPTHA
jgi:hypothetical protein